MSRKIGRNRNTSDEAETNTTALNDTTATKIKDAGFAFVRLEIVNESNKDVYIKLQAATIDNLKEGEFLPRGSVWEMPADQPYIGERSAIAVSGAPSVTVNMY